jgi:leucine dehydrogenase
VLRVEHSDILRQRGIVYAPDFVMNAGGCLNIAAERAPGGYSEARLYARVRNIACTLQQILSTAQRQGISTHCAAIELAKRRLAKGASGRVEVALAAAAAHPADHEYTAPVHS